ncbi:MAG TPA: hypothetical protein VD968_06165 [Pyrinomonadaceae bacterium]|nr:hypothetical protein [Pyrinomonadaceae bacterium]
MARDFDNELDTLLRRHARAGGAVRREAASAHLDADELSAFAENVLPAAARGAAVLHLADCDECRSQAVVLARAAGAGAALEKGAAQPVVSRPGAAEERRPSPFAWLVWLLSPRGLRYMAPVLALSLVGVVTYVALRSRGGDARLERAESARSAAPSAPQAVPEGDGTGAATSGAPSESPAQQPSVNGSAAANTGSGLVARQSTEPTPGVAPAPVAAGAGPAEKEPPPPPTAQQQPGGAAGGGSGSAAAESPAAIRALPTVGRDAPEQSKEDDRGRAKGEEVTRNDYNLPQQNRVKDVQNVETQSPDGGRARKQSPSNNAELAAAAPPKSEREVRRQNRSMSEPRARSAARAGAEADEGAREETRVAAGHRFRRQGGAWVDVNYKPSMSSTGVRRGTEAFRALVADIPEIGRVAEQISGEVIVVVSGRAYRIR